MVSAGDIQLTLLGVAYALWISEVEEVRSFHARLKKETLHLAGSKSMQGDFLLVFPADKSQANVVKGSSAFVLDFPVCAVADSNEYADEVEDKNPKKRLD